MAAVTDPKLQYPPLLNGLDYINSVVENLKDAPSDRNLKYAVLHLQAAVEVLLKVRLMREHWTLIFVDPNTASPASLRSGDFKSISLDDTIKRLDGVAGVTLDKKVIEGFKRLAKTRNKLQHFGLQETAAGIEALASEVLNGLLGFMRSQLGSGGTPKDDADVKTMEGIITEELHRLRGLVTARLEDIEPDLVKRVARGERIVECPQCRNVALVVHGQARHNCLFCWRAWDDQEELVWEFVSSVLHIWRDVAEVGHDPVRPCWECGSDALVGGAEIRGQLGTSWLCFSCGATGTPDEVFMCMICNDPMIGEGTVCSSCFNEKVHAE